MAKSYDTLKYKGKSIVRCGDVIFYGDISKSHVVRLSIKDRYKFSNTVISGLIVVELLKSAAVSYGSFRPLKSAEKYGLYQALDLSVAWLDRALSEKIKL